MKVVSLYLENFRNIEKTGFDLSGGVNVFYGRNAQGKPIFSKAYTFLRQEKVFVLQRIKNLLCIIKKKPYLI